MLINLRNAMMASRRSPLPPGARWVEYLESTGTQWIPSRFSITSGNVFSITAEFLSDSLASNAIMMGNNSNSQECFIYKNGGGYFGGGSFSSQGELVYGHVYDFVFDLTAGAMRLVKDGVVLKNSTITQSDRGNFLLFACGFYDNRTSHQITSITPRKMRVYRFRVISGGELVEDLVPIAIGTTGYMLDMVSGQYLPYGNAGTGDFVVGPDAN